METSDSNKIAVVFRAYKQAITARGGSVYANPGPITLGTKLYDNCLALFDAAEVRKVSLISFFLAILDYLPLGWCKQTFNRNYPPFSVMCSENSRLKALRSFPKDARPGEDRLAEFYFLQLKDLEPGIVAGLIHYGFFGDKDGDDLKERVINMLKNSGINL